MKALILAAGYGNRLRPYTDHTPKPLFPIAGRPLLDIAIEQLQKAGCRAVLVNTHHLHDRIEAFLASRSYDIEVSTRYEPRILGTGGAIKNAADFWDDRPFMVINADIVVDLDLEAVYRAHCRRRPIATLVLCDNPEFNSVEVDGKDNRWIAGFHTRAGHSRSIAGWLTFTGIQVLEPRVLDYIPANTFYSSIDAYKKILADGRRLAARAIPPNCWRDMGTPQSYRRAAVAGALPEAFRKAFAISPGDDIQWEKLKGDGSQRRWYRVTADRRSLIMADHGVRRNLETSEADSFVHLGLHLLRNGVSVPKIHFYDTFSGLVLLEDLGDVNLQQVVRSKANTPEVLDLYKSVITKLITLWLKPAECFDRSWTYQTPDYNRELILEKECRYFVEEFLNKYLGFPERFADLQSEFSALADRALRYPIIGFMHRDMQSRNIMIKNGEIYFIDFQGGRLGPVQYDLASLLIDPYVDLPPDFQARLLDDAIELLDMATELEPDSFRACYHYCRLTRNLQILGAFAYLTRVMGKKQFEPYIPAAAKTLRSNLSGRAEKEFPLLNAVARRVCDHLKIDLNRG